MRRFTCGIVLLLLTPLFGEDTLTRVFVAGQRLHDARRGPLVDLNGTFPFQVPKDAPAWRARAEQVRRRILVATGLWPLPARGPVSPTLHGRIDRGDYTVEKVYFESWAGFYVTGNLYRPKGQDGPHPAILSPHGHWNNGRFYDAGASAVREQIFVGAERFERGGRFPLQARCVQLARMGCVVFHYDMVGYADSKQISYGVAHRHAKPRNHLEEEKAWGYYTAQAEMRLQNIMGLQTFNSLRAVDFILGLPDVDPARLAVTGASGGGTQTMILAALEPRVAVSFPAVMVSTAMQGGCTCENATCLRVGTGNVEFAALFAPKPQGLNAADDWTRELATKGLPELQALYALLGAKDNIAGYALTQFPHNYNAVSRGKMYHFFNRHLKLGHKTPILERDYEPLSIEEMTVWNDDHPLPPGGEAFEIPFLKELSDRSDAQLQALAKTAPQDHARTVRHAFQTILATEPGRGAPLARENLAKIDRGSYWLFRDKLTADDVEMPLVFLHPKAWNGKVAIWVAQAGKASLFSDALHPQAAKLLAGGFSIAAPDLFGQGETREQPLTETRRVANDRDFAGYTFGYNRTLLGHQVHDVLRVVRFIAQDEHQAKSIHLVGVAGGTPQATLAKLLAGVTVSTLTVDDPDFRFARIRSWRDPLFLPGAIKYGDLPALLKLTGAKTLPRSAP